MIVFKRNIYAGNFGSTEFQVFGAPYNNLVEASTDQSAYVGTVMYEKTDATKNSGEWYH